MKFYNTHGQDSIPHRVACSGQSRLCVFICGVCKIFTSIFPYLLLEITYILSNKKRIQGRKTASIDFFSPFHNISVNFFVLRHEKKNSRGFNTHKMKDDLYMSWTPVELLNSLSLGLVIYWLQCTPR